MLLTKMNSSNIETVTQISIDIVSSVRLISSTKDSLHIKWDVDESNLSHVTEYKLRYQAKGSTVVQFSHNLAPNELDYDITQLHEDTVYTLCVQTFTDFSNSAQETCFNASTSTDSLSVALGSTFGAFLALGVIVLFVFIAKWQHTRKLRKRMKGIEETRESYESINQHDPDLEISDISLHVNEGTTIKYSEYGSSENIQASNGVTPNGIVIAAPSLANCSECSENLSSYPSSSYECCSCNHDECCRGGCEDPECNHIINPKQFKRHKRHADRDKKLIHQRSTDSRFSNRLPHQLSVDSYVSSHRGTLQRQRSRDSESSYRSARRRSHDSAASHQKYIPAAEICCDCHIVNDQYRDKCQQCLSSNSSLLKNAKSSEINAQNLPAPPTYNNSCNYNGTTQGEDEECQNNSANTQPQSNHSQEIPVITPPENPFVNPDGRPPDVRPKNPIAYMDYNRKFPDETLLDPTSPPGLPTQLSLSHSDQLHEQVGLKPNLSCPNW